MSSFVRVGSANAYDIALRNIMNRQSSLSNLQENLTSGKKVVRASDDPTGAAQAERAITRLARIETDQRALESQRNSITQAESTLADVNDALQNFRELAASAGNASHSALERKSFAAQLSGYRDQIFALANRKDTNGLPLFSALGSALAPFVGQPCRRTTPLPACLGRPPATKWRFLHPDGDRHAPARTRWRLQRHADQCYGPAHEIRTSGVTLTNRPW
jgi:flagellin-like hook-associated protein FlgL